jgi:prepilin-type N-terminal cleavage/methylation domain-containing protein
MAGIRNNKAFTLVELMVTLVITGILLSAVATLAFAMSNGSRAGADAAQSQAQLRLGTLRVLDLIQNCRMILTASATELAIWRSDENGDGHINVNELTYLQCNGSQNTVSMTQFSSAGNPEITFSSGSLSSDKATLVSGHSGTEVSLIPDCTNVLFTCDAAPPLTQQVTISFGLAEDGISRGYEVTVTLRAWAGHLLNDTQDGLVAEDDDE